MSSDGSLWPGIFGWSVLGASGLMYGGPIWSWIGVVAGSLALVLTGVQLWPGDDPPRAVAAVRRRGTSRRGLGTRRCRAKDPSRCSSRRCPDRRTAA